MAKKPAAHDDDCEPDAPAPHVTPATPGPVQHETTDAEDIDALATDIVALVQLAEYDDMTWPEVERSMRLASHQIRQIWAATGTVKAAPPPPEADPEAVPERESLSPAPRAKYAG